MLRGAWQRYWVSVAALVLALSAVAWPASGAAEERKEYDSQEECQRVEQYACINAGGKWRRALDLGPWNTKGTVGPPIIIDPVEAKEQGEAMPVNYSGTPEHPIVVVDMDLVNFCGDKAEPVVPGTTNIVEFPCDEALPWIDPRTNRTMIPIRFVSEAMGMEVKWDAATQTVTVRRDGLTVQLQVGNTTAQVNGQAIPVDAPPIVVPPGRVMVPLRFISEAFGAKVDWIGDEEESPDGKPGWGKYQIWGGVAKSP
ncbi:MAG: copper amine oxidase N-terminal domain-containing protein [Bacillota bacterium]